jgi:hypothetical protein
MHATEERCFLHYKQGTRDKVQFSSVQFSSVQSFPGVCEERIWAREDEESPLLEAIARERLVKTQQTGKGLAGAVVICELWSIAVAMQLLVLKSRVCGR